MLEGLVAWVLNNYLGKYVENLNTDQLSIALLSGQVELENLPLKKNALRHLGLPIEIEAGFIGKIILQIPVRQIRSAPWVIIIDQLYVVANPLSVQEWDAKLEHLAVQEQKLSALDALEAQWRLEMESKDNSAYYYASTYSSWLNYGAGLITDIIENLQLKIHDVHIRYEDCFSVPNKTVAFGITMESLSAQSCDSNWVPEFTHWHSSEASFKLVDMQKLAVYWIPLEQAQSYSNINIANLKAILSQIKSSSYNQHYILAPVSAQAHLKHNRSEKPLRSLSTPRIVCDLQMEEVPLSLVDWQYEQVVKCVNGLDDIARLRKFMLYKPECSVKEDAKSWWFYAVCCNFIDKIPNFCKPKPTWDSCLKRAKENVAYVKLYADILTTPTMALTPDNKKLKDAVEWDRNYNELKILRELAMRKVPAESISTNSKNSAGRGVLVRWFPTWMGWYSSTSSLETTVSPDHPPSQLEGEILEALSDSVANNTLLKRDMVFGQFNFTLNSGTLNLCTTGDNGNSSVPMIEFQFKNLSLKVTSCPRTASHTLELSLGAIYLRDKLTENSLFPILVGPPGQERAIHLARTKGSNPKLSVKSGAEERFEPLFYLLYEKRSENSGCDYKLSVKSKSLDVVYQPLAIKWLVEFACHPHQTMITQSSIEAMKTRTKKELIKNWEQIIDGRLSNRKSWELNLDISTPQIIFVEKFTDPNSAVVIIDFGKLHLQNTTNDEGHDINNLTKKESEDDEMFMTPCSTPPGSEEDNSETLTSGITPQQQQLILDDVLNEQSLHQKLYESYSVELMDLQVLISKAKDNWRYAHNKGTSPLHVLDRFNISMQIERCIVHTCDPLYPSLTVNANLPKLVAHINEQKVAAAKSLIDSISIAGFPSPFNTPENIGLENATFSDEDESSSIDMSLEMSRLLIFQFSIDQLALEVQSRGRSIAELQVAGVRASFSKRPVDTSINLSVHSLLLVDALQTFGPDFELLVASHKHVGMDSISGSLRDSEPTSPTSPASPDPGHVSSISITSPLAITQALSNLTPSPPHSFANSPLPRPVIVLDSEALITIEIVLITGLEPMHIANIQFNNLDIIANQETIVELMGFTHRVFPDISNKKYTGLQVRRPEVTASTDTIDAPNELAPSPSICRTEITFDFHRLNVLLLRGVVKDGSLIGKKIATATMSEARIQATVDNGVLVEGSLGGLQVVDLTPEGQIHQRIVSVGHDPLSETPHPMYLMSQTNQDKERKAFSFKIKRDVKCSENDVADISIRMASVWYTHSPRFIGEFQSCATEFKQYFANLARSIRAAATDMALGLVQSKTEALAQSLYMNSRLSSSLYGSAMSFSDAVTPKKRFRRSSSNQDPTEGVSGYSSARDTVDQTPYSPDDDEDIVINIKLDVVLDSPVVILPRSSSSPEVFVAHLGKISVTNRNETPENGEWNVRTEYYNVEVRDMNLYSLDTGTRRTPGSAMSKVDILYACDSLAKPILYDTILQLSIEREVNTDPQSRQRSLSNLLDEDYQTDSQPYDDTAVLENIQISGTFVTSLKLSLTRTQYEQLLATLQFLTTSFNLNNAEETPRASSRNVSSLVDICEEDTGVTTLKMDPHVRAKMFTAAPLPKTRTSKKRVVTLKVLFDLPLFTIELRGDSPTGEQGLVDLSFRDFVFNYEKCHPYETNIQVSLRSVTMEDLLQAQDSKQRVMVISSDGGVPCNPSCVSRSCPEGFGYLPPQSMSHCSLPDHLEPAKVLGVDMLNKIARHVEKRVNGCPDTPPPSPSAKERPQKNLVLISSLLVDPSAPNFKKYNSVERSTSVDFNCLDLVVNVESWVIVIDFFSVTPDNHQNPRTNEKSKATTKNDNIVEKENVETNISIRSLNIVLVKPQSDIAKINISHVEVSIKTDGIQKEVKGHLGSMSLLDLTLHGQLYKERFLTSGKQALHFIYTRFSPNAVLNFNAQLKLEMSSVSYVHTKRFVAELQAFFNRFTHLQAVMQSIRAATSRQQNTNEIKKLSIILQAEAPVLYLPVSSKSSDLLIADLGHLTVTNDFKYSDDESVISVVKNKETDKRCLLDVMFIELQNVDLYTGVRETSSSKTKNANDTHMLLGSSVIKRKGASLLKNKCHLKIQVERNLYNNIYHTVPDMSIQGELSTLDVTIDVQQYKLIRGLLFYNLGEYTEHILPSVSKSNLEVIEPSEDIWTLLSIKFNLMNVVLDLQKNYKSEPIARVNFIKSQLTVESFSNFSQDVDLVSQEIVVVDTRSHCENSSNRNVFTNILQSIVFSHQDGLVQLEVHSRKKQDKTKFTILLNNMRLMTIFDWWESALKFIFENYEEQQPNSPTHESSMKNDGGSFELKLNITDSEIVVVQDISRWDTNAVILKSTTVVTYKSYDAEKPLSMNLNNCEAYSCVLGMEEETALSIIDPVTLNMEINARILEVQLNHLNVHVSYRDMRMFLQILNSLPQQFLGSKNTKECRDLGRKDEIYKLVALGFSTDDCMKAYDICERKLDDAALWLTQNAVPLRQIEKMDKNKISPTSVTAVEIKAGCIVFTIIDDCGDSDVPLLEVSFSKLFLRQCLDYSEIIDQGQSNKNGALECSLSADYFNRILSGWEPILEPWKCHILWDNVISSSLIQNRLQINVESKEILNLNVTSTFTELYQQVKNNWMQDFYLENNSQESKNLYNYKSRSPFVPFVLKNDTGCPLYFTTLINELDSSFDLHELLEVTERWALVAPGETVPFTFRSREKKRHKDSHTLKMHQLCVKVEGWQSVHPVTVDKVGVYFRHAAPEVHSRTLREPPNARIVFDVALKGLAQKQVTVRSSLLIVNKLNRDIEVKLENTPYSSTEEFWIANKTMTIKKNEMLAAPLTHAHSQITMRPVSEKTMYSYCSSHVSWKQVTTPGECCYELRSSSTSKNHLFRYCVEVKRENYPPDRASALIGVNGHYLQPGHTITVLPILLINNLLPVDLSYDISKGSGRISSGGEASLTNVDPDDAFEINVCLENFPISSKLLIPSNCVAPFNCRIRLADHAGRRLFLQANVIPNSEAKIKVSFSAPFWIINKTGLPLVFKQGGVTSETAGQFEEHEVARMLTPLLFSFADSDASPTVTARVGNALNSNGTPVWCQNFHLRKGTQVRRLHVSLKDGGTDIIYLIGIQVRMGRGKYRSTSIVTISPRYQLHNKSSYRLTFTQKCFANTADELSHNTYCKTTPGCHMSFHWPRLDKEQLLCVLIEDVSNCCFSGGLKIDKNDSMHVNVRDNIGRIYFLRMEVVLEGATFFVIFADADTMPPPIRVDNFSEVPITFWQTCCKDLLRCNVRAHTSIPYAWDEPTGSPFLTVSAPGGVSNNYDMNKIGNVPQLTYENFIYIAFAGTFKDGEDVLNDPMDVENQQLVLDVVNGKQVILNRKIPGQRSQLWRMTASGELQHEGSSPPSHPQQPRSENVLVLDIEGPAPQPNTYNRLMLRKPDPRRRSTQTWRFTDDGRLCCAHYRMCVQAQDGFFGLRPGNAAILGLPQPICHRTTETGIPLEQAVTRQRLRPGSGILSVEISTDGPTRVLNIRDMHEKSVYAVPDEREWNKIVKKQRPKFRRPSNEDDDDDDVKRREYQCILKLSGVGVSVVTRKPFEELLYAKFETIVGDTVLTRTARTFCVSVRDIQIDNQLLDTTVPVLLYVTPPKTNRNDDEYYKLPALDISTEIQPTPNENAVIFKHLIVNLKKLTINLEEKFILKLLSFIEVGSKEEETIPDSTSEYDYDMQRMLSEVSASYAKRYYFGVIHLIPNQIKLSMKTASKLPPELKAVKKKLDIPFIKFEDALVDLEPFVRRHPFETAQFLLNSIKKHFKDELIWQAAIILGSVDVLGNPVGFMNDVSEGVSGFFTEGSVRTLVKNVTHGLSNSAAKVTESISDGLGRVTMDDEHEEMRQRIRQVESGKSGDHLLAGIKGLSFGILGGATSIFKHVYEGAANEGIQGVFSGLGKGLVGTVTKPVVGMLDLASETARAVRETSRSRISPERSRLPRCVWGTGGLLLPYSKKQSKAQQLLYTVSDRNFSEHLVAFERLRGNSEDLKILVSNQKIWIVGLTTVLEVHLSDLQQCQPVTVTEGSDNRYYIEITMKVSNTNSTVLYQEAIKRPRIRCDSYDLARWVSQQVNYAKRLYDERLHTLTSDVLQVEE